VKDNNDGTEDGTYLITFRPSHPSECELVIAIRSPHIYIVSAFGLVVANCESGHQFGVVTKIFGSEGSEPGQLCRSWAICSDAMGNIIIGDRSNHCIQIFDSNCSLMHCFGTKGVHPGQLNRPAGVAVSENNNGNVVVIAD